MELKKRGRTLGQTKLISKIESPSLGKFHIELNEDGYNLMEKDNINPIGYFLNITGCIKKTSELLVLNGKTYTLNEYSNEYKNILKQLKQLING